MCFLSYDDCLYQADDSYLYKTDSQDKTYEYEKNGKKTLIQEGKFLVDDTIYCYLFKRGVYEYEDVIGKNLIFRNSVVLIDVDDIEINNKYITYTKEGRDYNINSIDFLGYGLKSPLKTRKFAKNFCNKKNYYFIDISNRAFMYEYDNKVFLIQENSRSENVVLVNGADLVNWYDYNIYSFKYKGKWTLIYKGSVVVHSCDYVLYNKKDKSCEYKKNNNILNKKIKLRIKESTKRRVGRPRLNENARKFIN